jgi:hypothetical protein
MFNKISNEFGTRLKALVDGQRGNTGAPIKPFGDRSIPQALGNDTQIRELIITTNNVLPVATSALPQQLHGYFSDDPTHEDVYPNLYLSENLGVLRKAGTNMIANQCFAIQDGGNWRILHGQFQTVFKAKVKTADIGPNQSNTVTIWWDDFNSATVSLISSGVDVTAFNRLTQTVGKDDFVEIAFSTNDSSWYIVGADDPAFLVSFELKNNLTTGGTATAWKIRFDDGDLEISRTSENEIDVFDPHSQFRGVGQSVRSAGGSRGVARWIEGNGTKKYQIIEMQSPAMMIKYTVSGAVAKANQNFIVTTADIVQPLDGLYIIGCESGAINLTINKDTTFSIPSSFSGYAVWNKTSGHYEALPVQIGADLSQLRFDWNTGSNHQVRFSIDGGSTWTTILTAVSQTNLSAFQADGTNKKLQDKTRAQWVFSVDTESGWNDIDTGLTCS